MYYSKNVKRCFYHFQERLRQRYDLDIEIEEYIYLCKNNEFNLLKVSDNKRMIGTIHFKSKDIKVARQPLESVFLIITALK